MDIGLSIMIRCLASECPRPQRAGQFDGRAIMAGTTHHKALIVGGGTAGITVAASLKRQGPGGIDIAIVEPSDTPGDWRVERYRPGVACAIWRR